jgi:hypothetical protein
MLALAPLMLPLLLLQWPYKLACAASSAVAGVPQNSTMQPHSHWRGEAMRLAGVKKHGQQVLKMHQPVLLRAPTQ